MLEAVAWMFPHGWEVGSYGDTLICPHGSEVEQDGGCPDGCLSPLLALGLI